MNDRKKFSALHFVFLLFFALRAEAIANEVWAKHILVETKNEAMWLTKQLESGKKFEQLAKTYSIGPSGPHGGDLGSFKLGEMVNPFEELVFSLPIGGWKSVKTQFGGHIAKVYNRRPKSSINYKPRREYVPLGTQQKIPFSGNEIQVLKEAKINDLTIRHVRMANSIMKMDCRNGFTNHIELSGPINNDSTFIVEKLMDSVEECITEAGIRKNNFIILNSGGGLLSDGYALGRMIREKNSIQLFYIMDFVPHLAQ